MKDVWFTASFASAVTLTFRFSRVMAYSDNNTIPQKQREVNIWVDGITKPFVTLKGDDADRFLFEYNRWISIIGEYNEVRWGREQTSV